MALFPRNSRVKPSLAFRKTFPLSAHHKAGTVVVMCRDPVMRGVQWDGLVTWRNIHVKYLEPLDDGMIVAKPSQMP